MNPSNHADSLGRLDDLPADYIADMTALSIAPLWPQLRGLLPRGKPARATQPFVWHYAEVRPQLMRAGELTPIEKAERRVLVLCNPGIHVSTAAAYAKVEPKQDGASIQVMLIENGIQRLINDFEHSVFEQFPEISDLKTNLKEAGAYYAAMSGSGSSVFALFNQQPILTDRIQKYVVFQGEWTL